MHWFWAPGKGSKRAEGGDTAWWTFPKVEEGKDSVQPKGKAACRSCPGDQPVSRALVLPAPERIPCVFLPSCLGFCVLTRARQPQAFFPLFTASFVDMACFPHARNVETRLPRIVEIGRLLDVSDRVPFRAVRGSSKVGLIFRWFIFQTPSS
jgi:hypothetical protein